MASLHECDFGTLGLFIDFVEVMKMDMIELKNQIENLQHDIAGLTALVHAFLEGIRSGSVSMDEIINATAVLYLLMDIFTEQMENTKNGLVSVSE